MVKLNAIDLDIVPRLADSAFAREWVAMVDEDSAAKDRRIEKLEAALCELIANHDAVSAAGRPLNDMDIAGHVARARKAISKPPT